MKKTWIIGAGGLLGGALASEFPGSFSATPIHWSDDDRAVSDLHLNLEKFLAEFQDPREAWQIIWAAGHATVSSSKEVCQRELGVFSRFIDALNATALGTRGTFFLTSSAGGVYAGSPNPPFSHASPTFPTSDYGTLKLAQESKALELINARVLIGRVSNLYGPGQDLSKLQGLVSRLVVAGLEKETINIFVPLDTLRDFVYVQDAAGSIAQLLADPQSPTIAVIASGEPKSLGTVIHQVQDVLRIKIPIAFGIHESSASQSADLRMIPTLPGAHATPFPVGVKNVIADLLDRMQNR